jgi:hypothetical protein
MKPALALSVALNVLLIGLLAVVFNRPPPPQPAAVPAQPDGRVQPREPEKPLRLDWRSVESADYKQYVQNLREIGCPEETIFDIIVADVNSLYAMKARSLRPAREWNYWEAADEVPSREEIRNQKLRRELEREKQALIAAILGPDALEKLRKYLLWGGEESADRKLAFLSEEKRKKLKALQEKFFELEQQATEWDSTGVMTEETMQKLAALAKQRRAEIEGMLSPAELQELDFRTSETATRLRQELTGFHPTEQEFRALYGLRKAWEDQVSGDTNIRDSNVLQQRQQAEQLLDQNARAALGEQRYPEYQRSRDLDYLNTLRMTAYFGLPPTAANEVYDLKNRDEKLAQDVLATTAMTEEQKTAALEQMRNEAERQLTQILGDKVFQEYRRSNRWWMRSR